VLIEIQTILYLIMYSGYSYSSISQKYYCTYYYNDNRN